LALFASRLQEKPYEGKKFTSLFEAASS